MTEPNEQTTVPSNYYIDNNKFYQACLEHKNACILAEKEGKPKPKLNDYIGDCILKIATRLSHSRNFINYPYRSEMIGDAVENCILYFHNFDPIKYKSPFNYFTQIAYYAFLRRIEREKKQMYIKHKAMMNKIDEGLADSIESDGDDDFGVSIDGKLTDNQYMNEFVSNFEKRVQARRESRRVKKGVEKFFEGEQEEDGEPDLSIDSEDE